MCRLHHPQSLGQAQRLCKADERLLNVAQEAARPGVDDDGGGLWEAQCTVLLWLATLVLLPFSMLSLDSTATGFEPRCASPLPARLRPRVSGCASVPTCCCTSAATCTPRHGG